VTLSPSLRDLKPSPCKYKDKKGKKKQGKKGKEKNNREGDRISTAVVGSERRK
jgi:hypothetical protein